MAATGGTGASAALEAVEWSDAVYLSTCGLPMVVVQAGVGEASTRFGPTGAPSSGLEVIGAAEGDLDGDGATEAAVLVDCLGGDTYRPHVVVVRTAGVGYAMAGPATAGDAPSLGHTTLTPSAGGSLPAGRPVSIALAPDHTIEVVILRRGRREVHRLVATPAVLAGGELGAGPGSIVEGVLAADEGGVVTVSVAPDEGYRLRAPVDLVVDPGAGAPPVPAVQAVGRRVHVEVGPQGTVTRAAVLP